MKKLSKNQIDKIRDSVNEKKFKLENRIKKIFHTWHIKVYKYFLTQFENQIVSVPKELELELKELLLEHYSAVAKEFVPGLKFDGTKQELPEEEEDNKIPFLFFGAIKDISDSLEDQTAIQLPIHFNSIIETTNQIGNVARVQAQKQDADYKTILAGLLIGRETTVSITETNWIAEASMNTALLITTPLLKIADRKTLKELQSLSPNITLKEEDIDTLFDLGSVSAIEEFRQELSTPKKTWVDMGDSRVRPSHVAISGTTINVDEPFKLEGGLMMFPGDSSLGVSFLEIINCRCHLIYS